MSTEAITWRALSDPPDSDITVLLFDPDASVAVWPGYLDGTTWRDAEGMPADPVAWASMPKGGVV